MDAEIQNFIKVWFVAIASLLYCYFIVSKIPSGLSRLVSLLPIVYLFITLPFSLTSIHLGDPTTFYLLWLGNFKLLLFSFNQGPLSSHPPLSLLDFISIALLPVQKKTNTKPSFQSSSNPKNIKQQNTQSPNSDSINAYSQRPRFKILELALFAIKLVLLNKIISLYQYREHLYQTVIVALYCCHVYLGVELILAITAAPVRALLGLEIEPQFNKPYLTTSLQDFWGRRWNLMVTSILRPTVYKPIRSICTPILGGNWSLVPAILASFLVSGLMHEVIYYYMSRASPTWEVTWFFVLHGACVAAEIAVKKALNGRCRLHRAVSGPLTIAFVAVTGAWLFFPQLIRYGVDLKAINEYHILLRFLREKLGVPTIFLGF